MEKRMKFHSLILIALASYCHLVWSMGSRPPLINSSPALELNYNDQMVFRGTGCNLDNTQIVIEQNKIQLLFEKMEINLLAFEGDRKIDRKSCRILIPVKLKRGYKIDLLNYNLNYEYALDPQTDGKLQVAAGIFSNPIFSIRKTIDSQLKSLESIDREENKVQLKGKKPLDDTPFCSTEEESEDLKGILTLNFSLSGYRPKLDQSFFLKFDVLENPMEFNFNVSPCVKQ